MWEGVLAWLAIGSGLVATVVWLLASRVRMPPFPDVGWSSSPAIFRPVHRALSDGARLNAWAAGVTAGAVMLQTASLAAHQLGW